MIFSFFNVKRKQITCMYKEFGIIHTISLFFFFIHVCKLAMVIFSNESRRYSKEELMNNKVKQGVEIS